MEAVVLEPDVGYRRLRTLSFADLEAPPRWFCGGGFGDIYRSQMWGLGVALKLVRGTRQSEKGLLKEARLMEQAQFVYVLPLLAFYSDPEGECVKYGLVTQYMPNGCLSTLFSKASPVPWALRFRIIHQVASGMHYLHDLRPPLLHLDLKRSNVLLDENLKVQLTDFGLSKSKSVAESSSSAGNIAGTLAYMPPEALVGGNEKQESFDIYSFGVLIWTVVTAKEPYEGALLAQILVSVPAGGRPDLKPLELHSHVKMVPEAIDLMKQCWHQEPARRPPFRVCIGKTSVMFHAYEDEMDDAVRCVKDILKKKQAEPQGNLATAAPSTGIVETDKVDRTTESFHPSINKTVPVVPHPPSKESSAAAPTQRRTPETDLSSPATQKNLPETGSKKKFIKTNFSRLLRKMPSVQSMLDQLTGKGIFNREEMETILAKETLTEQKRTMLLAIIIKGEPSSEKLCHLLNELNTNFLSSLEFPVA